MTLFAPSPSDVAPLAQAPIALVRHGETDWNLAQRIQGRTDIPLNDTGRTQAQATAQALAAVGPWRSVRSSPLGRAVETAKILAAGLGLPTPDRDTNFWERNFGEAEGLGVAEAQARWPGLNHIDGAESLDSLAERTAAALDRVLTEAPRSIVVAHGAMLRAGLSAVSGTEIPRIMNGEVWLMFRTPGGVRVTRLEESFAL